MILLCELMHSDDQMKEFEFLTKNKKKKFDKLNKLKKNPGCCRKSLQAKEQIYNIPKFN